jgi:hypothetical protein
VRSGGSARIISPSRAMIRARFCSDVSGSPFGSGSVTDRTVASGL